MHPLAKTLNIICYKISPLRNALICHTMNILFQKNAGSSAASSKHKVGKIFRILESVGLRNGVVYKSSIGPFFLSVNVQHLDALHSRKCRKLVH